MDRAKPICGVSVFTPKEYDAYIDDGYVEASSEEMVHNASKGRYVYLEKELSKNCKVATVTGCIFAGPALLVGVVASLGLATPVCFSYYRYLCVPTLNGGSYEEEGYLRDKELTMSMVDEDFKALDTVGWNLNSVTALAERHKDVWLQLRKSPQHKYFSVEGPISKISYLIVVPNGDVGQARCWSVADSKGKPCNANEIRKKAEVPSRRCKPRRVVMVDERSPLIQTESTAPDDGLSVTGDAETHPEHWNSNN